MYNPDRITIYYTKPVNYNISPRRGIARNVGCTSVECIDQLPAKIAEVNAMPGCCVTDAYTMSGKRVAL